MFSRRRACLPALLAVGLIVGFGLQGCVATTVAGATLAVAGGTVKTAAKVTGKVAGGAVKVTAHVAGHALDRKPPEDKTASQ